MPTYTQQNRMMAVAFDSLEEDALLLETLSGSEAVSEPFRFELGLLAEPDTEVDFESVLGQSATVQLRMPDGSDRYFNGIVSRLSQGAQVAAPNGQVMFVRYQATLVPQLWLLTRVTQSRIFQQMAVPDILREVLSGLTVDWQLQGTYEPRDYCTQYRETDFAFASRLMEEEGIYYYFKHDDGAHTLVVADTPDGHAEVPGPTELIYELVQGGVRDEDRILGWVKTQEVRSGKVTLWDHCFEKPGDHLDATKAIQSSVAVGTVDHSMQVGGNDTLELYDFPGGYAQRFDGVAPGGGDRASDIQKIFTDNGRTAGIRMQQEAVPGLVIYGESNVRHLTAGHTFTLTKHFNADGDYVLTRVEHWASLADTYTGSGGGATYSNRFTCIPIALPFRPPQVTPKARVWGTQTATVVGPAGEEIFTDKYSRVKVQFHWDRQGANDANSSCWCRVATFWAGKQWGAIHIPRIGQEVVVAYEEGDPDQPIIVGSVYNAAQMPPYTLPDNRTQSGIKSRSSLQGTEDNYNELRFEDKKGSEQIYFHAEKNFDRVVENNDTLHVGFDKMDPGDQKAFIFNNQQVSVGYPSDNTNPTDGSQKVYVWNNRELVVGNGEGDAADGTESIWVWNNQNVVVGYGEGQNSDGSQTTAIYKDRTTTLKTGDDTLTVQQGKRTTTIQQDDVLEVKQGNRTTTVDTGNDSHQVKTGNRDVKIDMGNDALTISMGNQTTKLDLGASSTEAMQSITLKVGGNSITIDQTGITIKGIMVTVEGQAMLQAKSPMTQVNGDGMLMLKGGLTMIN